MSALTREEVQERLSRSPFHQFLGLQVESVDAEKQQLTVTVAMRPEFERAPDTGQWHGGVLSSLVDIVGDYALAIELGKPMPTVNLRVDFLRPAINTALRVVATVRRAGKTVAFVDVELFNEQGPLLAIGRANYSVSA